MEGRRVESSKSRWQAGLSLTAARRREKPSSSNSLPIQKTLKLWRWNSTDLLQEGHQVELCPVLCNPTVDDTTEVDSSYSYSPTRGRHTLEFALVCAGNSPAARHDGSLRNVILDGYLRIRERCSKGLHESCPVV